MARRIRLTPGRVVISKPGFDAANADTIGDRNKVFDSNWNFSGTMLQAGRAAGWNQASNAPITIPFGRTYSFVPAARVVGFYRANGGFPTITGYQAYVDTCQWGANSRVFQDRIYLESDTDNATASEYILWQIYGVR
ncbi:hypothetical protein [Rhizobium grahamii]|uniref:Uncharacterized protein n=1 Tax=Rhizobium grahamii CCGE 502 TaxID=990285 RepID=S3I2Y0_9HYPH|nr:hypothetical protein [Rhizobium grahamii]EPE99541.1 hypothetical protein RGCCGE502_05140 [Rhizobium grahamii CCGE 502]